MLSECVFYVGLVFGFRQLDHAAHLAGASLGYLATQHVSGAVVATFLQTLVQFIFCLALNVCWLELDSWLVQRKAFPKDSIWQRLHPFELYCSYRRWLTLLVRRLDF